MTKVNGRESALKILERMELENLYVNQAVDDYFFLYELEVQDRRFISRLVYGTVEQQLYLDHIIDQYSKLKTHKLKKTVLWVLRLSIYQLLFMDSIPDSAVCNEAVKMMKKRNMVNLTGFINGVLRTVAREKDNLPMPDESVEPLKYMSIRYAMPLEILQYLRDFYDLKELKTFCIESLKTPLICVRNNAAILTPNELRRAFTIEGTPFIEGHITREAFYLEKIDQLNLLPSFNKGLFQVQDESSMLIGEVVKTLPKEQITKVLDCCAAPGGKATHVAAIVGKEVPVIARDVSENKLKRIEENALRLKLKNIEVQKQDATNLVEADIKAFPLVIADLPCSGLGIIRKKPDIKYHITAPKIKELIVLQRKILETVQAYVAEDGYLILSTCTINPEENEHNVTWFLNMFQEFEQLPIQFKNLRDTLELSPNGEVKLMPNEQLSDGFYITLLHRKKS